MISKIMTFAIILQTPISDKNQVKEILLNRGYDLKHYDIGIMVAYDKDGKKIENKLPKNPSVIGGNKQDDKFQLKGKFCNVDFVHNNPTIFHQFGTKMEHIQFISNCFINV